jgi:hypothetical protein
MVPDQQQDAIRRFIRAMGGHVPFADRYALNPRTAQRIYSGKAACPRHILADIETEQADG